MNELTEAEIDVIIATAEVEDMSEVDVSDFLEGMLDGMKEQCNPDTLTHTDYTHLLLAQHIVAKAVAIIRSYN